jgi:hypothetical protein
MPERTDIRADGLPSRRWANTSSALPDAGRGPVIVRLAGSKPDVTVNVKLTDRSSHRGHADGDAAPDGRGSIAVLISLLG